MCICKILPVPPGPSSIENDAHGIEKLLLKTQESLTTFLQSEVKIIHIIVQNNTYYSIRSRWTKQQQKVYGLSVWFRLVSLFHHPLYMKITKPDKDKYFRKKYAITFSSLNSK